MFSESFYKTAGLKDIIKGTGLPYIFHSKGKAKLREKALDRMITKSKIAPKKQRQKYKAMATRAAEKYKNNPRAIDITRGRTSATLMGLGAGGGAMAKRTYDDHIPDYLKNKVEGHLGLREKQ